MSSYFIFVLVLTVAYVLYYATMIALDLKKKPDEGKDTTEVIEVDSTIEEDESIAVTESEHGFSVGEQEYESTIAPVPIEEQRKEEAEKQQAVRERISNMNGKMERARVSLSKPMYDEEYHAALLSAKHGKTDCKVSLSENWSPTNEKKV